MNVVDSSGWLEYFTDGKNADAFAPVIEDTEHLLVPVLCIYEVFKHTLQHRDLATAQISIADMIAAQTIDLDATLAVEAAILSAERKLPMADSIILATARAYDATLWTQDEHFANLEGVEFISKSH